MTHDEKTSQLKTSQLECRIDKRERFRDAIIRALERSRGWSDSDVAIAIHVELDRADLMVTRKRRA